MFYHYKFWKAFWLNAIAFRDVFYYAISTNKLESKTQFNFRKQRDRVNLIGTYCSRHALCQPADLEQSQPSESSRGENERDRGRQRMRRRGRTAQRKRQIREESFCQTFLWWEREQLNTVGERDMRETEVSVYKMKTVHRAQGQDAFQLSQSQWKDSSNSSGGIALVASK